MRSITLLMLVLVFSVETALSASVEEHKDHVIHVRYPSYLNTDQTYIEIQKYRQDLLKLALDKSGHSYSLEKIAVDIITSNRNMRNLSLGLYDVNWMHTNAEREANLIPIRIPIHKGLIGWRISFIRRDMQDIFANINSIDELKTYRLGQGYDWPDTSILKSHGFTLVESSGPENLINMLRGKRLDFFPRSLIEIWGEYETWSATDFVIDSNIALVYPTAFYTFVGKNNAELAELIERGLEASIKDGSFDKLFNLHFQPLIEKAGLKNRKIFRISNPTLPEKTPLNRPELWFNIDGV